jgi:UDP-N-acetylmuramate-alanine ligase
MKLTDIHSIYFIGIGGIGMSALARFFNERNVNVYGYDRTHTPLTNTLEQEGINITYEDNIDTLQKNVNLVVYTPAISAHHSQLTWYRENNYLILKRSDVLQIITNEMKTICVAGTHGKTSVSTLIAHILKETGVGCNAFLGGISTNYQTNYWSSPNPLAVIEADEYDRSFLKLNPEWSIVTAMDPDHLDIYGTADEMEKCYLSFISQTQSVLLYKHGIKHSQSFDVNQKLSYALQNDAANYYAANIRMKQGCYVFDAIKNGEYINTYELNIGGMHNVENCMAAIAICDIMNIDSTLVKSAVASFKGVKRRFEYIVKNERLVYIDDYAHHPEELRMLINSAKALFPGKKVSIVFQPHLYTRTRDFAEGFARSLDLADEIILLDIYPARELPIEGVSTQMIIEKMANPIKNILSKEGVLTWIKASKFDVLITAGAGDIDTLVLPIKQILHSTDV